VGDILRRELRTPDVAGRIGGEEFGLLLPGTGIDGACRTAERIRQAFAATSVEIGEHSLRFTASFGVAPLTGATSPEAALKQADEALYRAKASGRDRVWVGGDTESDRDPEA
jgi:diguanylate cyclase (GGDEF)-like protein